MLLSRLVFELRLETNLTDGGLIDIVVKPAETNRLKGTITRCIYARYYVILEGALDAVLMYEAVIEYLAPGIGTLVGMHSSHGHEVPAFAGNGVNVSDTTIDAILRVGQDDGFSR